MRALSIQVQPNRAPEIDMAKVSHEFHALLLKDELIKHHDFNSGDDKGLYFNFTLGTTNPEALWALLQEKFYGDDAIGRAMRKSSMAMCSSEEGWDDYLLLFHFDSKVKLDAPALTSCSNGTR